jgi:hypothetical protein
MNQIRGQEFHSIIENIFGDVKGLNVSEQLQVDCPHCANDQNLPNGDGKLNLEINTAKRKFRCWRCDNPPFSGSLRRLVRTFGTSIDYDLYKSYESIYGDYEYTEDDEKEYVQVKLPEEMILFSEMEIGNLEHFEAYNYLINDRMISRDIILKYRLGFCTTGKYEKRIIIPSYDKNGEVNYFVGRNYDTANKKKKPYDNPKSDKDKIIFNEGFVNWDSTVYLVEGTFEMLSFPVNIIPMLGKTISSTLFFKLKELKPHVVVLLDPDAYKNSIELYYQLHTIYVDCEERVRLVKLPTEDDLDELRRHEGIDAVIKSLRTARGLIIDDYFINTLRKPYDKQGTRRYDSNSKYFGWKSNSTRNTV